MAAKILFILAAIAVIAFASDNECKCDPPSEMEDTTLWDFLKTLSADVPEGTDDRLDAVLPGELSPLLCNCLDKAEMRRKRKILPEVVEGSIEADYDFEPELKEGPKCAEGYIWIGIMCAPNRAVLDKWTISATEP